MKVLLIGGGAREHAIGEALAKGGAEVFVVAQNDNPGLRDLATDFSKRSERDAEYVCAWATERRIEIAVIGLEDALSAGIPNALADVGIPTVGPSNGAASIETSKLFARELMRRHDIPGQVEYRFISRITELEQFLRHSQKQYAIKPVGLTAGKGVKVMGVHLDSPAGAIAYGKKVIERKIGEVSSGLDEAPGVLVEERLDGEEFTLQAFVDGETVVPMPLVRDYKRALEGDQGSNTGSMGSYSQADGLLPFVPRHECDGALDIMRRVVHALRAEGMPYRGILYGQFMMTPIGLKVVEFNARFGDPEAMNVLPLLETNFVDICTNLLKGRLAGLDVKFSSRATVCKYITPLNYPDNPLIGEPIAFDRERIAAEGVRLYFAKVKVVGSALVTTSSRFAAMVGIADSVAEAEAAVERALSHVEGRFHVRHDIGKSITMADQPRVSHATAFS